MYLILTYIYGHICYTDGLLEDALTLGTKSKLTSMKF